MLRFLADRYCVDAVFECGEEARGGGQPFAADLGAVASVPRLPGWRRLLAPISSLPHHHAVVDQRRFASTIRSLAGAGGYDFVWMNKSWLYPAISEAIPGVPVFIEQHAAERDVWENLIKNDPRWFVRLYSRWNWRKVFEYERGLYPHLAGAISISNADAETTRETYPPVPLIAVPVGVDCAYYKSSGRAPDPHTLLFSGNSATRNVEAMRRFVTRIAPRLRAADPAFRVLWIGKLNPADLDFLPNEALDLTGYVDHVPAYLEKGAIFVAPFDMGEGVKIKIVEALAMGRLIVSTRVGIRGVGIEGQPFVRVADDDEGFARAILEFSRSTRRAELAMAARQYAVEHFDSERVVEPLGAFITESLATWRRRKGGAG